MLRRKLIKLLWPLVALLMGMALVAIVLLQGVLGDIEHLNAQAWRVEGLVSGLAGNVGVIEVKLYELKVGREHHLDTLVDEVSAARERVSEIGKSYIVGEAEAKPYFDRVKTAWPEFERHVAVQATVQDPAISRVHNDAALSAALELRQAIVPLRTAIDTHGRREQEELIGRMRWIVLGLAVSFLLVINAAVLVLLRAAGIVLAPVDRLVQASRELAAERFDHRVELSGNDEFGELARAFNQLAGELQANSEQRLETLRQVATMLNHELNNAGAIIELQLQLLARRAGDPANTEHCLRRIRDSLSRMTQTVGALKNVKRIVLTDYVEGTKMLDLPRSTQDVTEEPATTKEEKKEVVQG
jgi:HAMP domain-containing protein